MELRIFDLNGGFLRKMRFLNHKMFLLPFYFFYRNQSFFMTHKTELIWMLSRILEMFLDLSLILSMIVTVVNRSLSFDQISDVNVYRVLKKVQMKVLIKKVYVYVLT